MNKAEAIRGNMNASKEETSAFLREMGIKSLRQRAGEMGGGTKAKAPDSIQVFAKKKKIKLEKDWQMWVYMEWIRKVFGDRQRQYKLTDEFWTLSRMAYENIRLKRTLASKVK
jgi:hypothetical protein